MHVFPRSLGQIPGARSLLLAGSFFLLLAGCSVSEPKADLVIINSHEPESLDPAIGTTLEDLRTTSSLFEGLTRCDPVTSQAIPGLAKSWDISPDGRIYTFHLRENIRWSTGEPITANDFVYSWLRVLDPHTGADYAGQLYYVKNGEAFNAGKADAAQVGIHALDARTLRVELNNPTAFFLDICTMPVMAAVPRQSIEKYGDGWVRAMPVPSSGAYMLGAWRLNDKIRLLKNPYYWDAANTRMSTVDLLPISTPSTVLNLYETGVADIVWDKDVIPPELINVLQHRPDFHHAPFLATYYVCINVTHKPFDDVRVRKALALSVDKKRIVDRILHGGESPASHLVPDGTSHYQAPEGLGYDPAEARRLLAEAGYPGGKGFPAFEYLLSASGTGGGNIHAQIAVEIQQMWQQELGIQVSLHQMEKKVYIDAQDHLNYDVSRTSWIGDYNDPNTFLDLFRSNNGNNRTGWKNPHYDQLMDEANQQPDLAKRAALLAQAETLLVRDEMPIIPIYYYIGFNYYNPSRIKGIYPNILDNHPLNDIWKVKD